MPSFAGFVSPGLPIAAAGKDLSGFCQRFYADYYPRHHPAHRRHKRSWNFMSKLIELSDLPRAAQGPVLFWQRTIKNPRQVCSLFPSSPFVGRAMTSVLGDRTKSHIIELGAGTGAVTRQLIRNGVQPEKLTLIEIDAQLGGHLRRRFPGTDVVIGSAAGSGQALARAQWRKRWRNRFNFAHAPLFQEADLSGNEEQPCKFSRTAGCSFSSPTGRIALCRRAS